jgi:hypothetical protein
MTGILYEGQYTFLSEFDQLFLEWEPFQSYIVNQNTSFCLITFSNMVAFMR